MMKLVIAVVIAAILICVLCGYLYLKRHYQYWKKRNVPYLEPDSLFFGNFRDAFTGKSSMFDHVQKLYNDLAPHKYGGVFFASKPIFFVRDPELIKKILIQDSHHFADHGFDLANEHDPLSQHLFHMKGQEWKDLRYKLTPTFTPGKVRMLFGLMKTCAAKLEKIVEKSAHEQETVNVKELMARYTTDVIISCAFGLEAGSLNDASSAFRLNGKTIFAPSFKRQLYDFLLNACPKLLWMVGHSPLPQKVNDFFLNVVNDTVHYRQENDVVRNDFLNLLMSLRENENNLDFNMAAQCFFFYTAAFESSAETLTFILYELAEHPDIQEKLHAEIDLVFELHDGDITYDCLKEMHYMEKVFNESSRMFSIATVLQRICTEDYRVPDSDLLIKRGEALFIPAQGLHRDPQYYPNPDVFNPENFSKEAKAARPRCTFLPFGDGPRTCIGSRFGMTQVKLALTTVLRAYSVTRSPRMKLPVEIRPWTVIPTSKDGILLNFHRRNTGADIST